MNIADHQSQWAGILQITERLQQLLKDEDWQDMAKLSEQRQSLLERFFSVEIPAHKAQEIAQGIIKIKESDRSLMLATKKQQHAIAAEMQKISTGRQAIKAYRHFK